MDWDWWFEGIILFLCIIFEIWFGDIVEINMLVSDENDLYNIDIFYVEVIVFRVCCILRLRIVIGILYANVVSLYISFSYYILLFWCMFFRIMVNGKMYFRWDCIELCLIKVVIWYNFF